VVLFGAIISMESENEKLVCKFQLIGKFPLLGKSQYDYERVVVH
jgi:hypothetical protein